MAADKVPDGVIESSIGTGRAAFAPETNTAFVLNATAARIWDLARAGFGVEDVAAQLSDETGTPIDEVEPHVVRTVAELVRRRLLTIDPAP